MSDAAIIWRDTRVIIGVILVGVALLFAADAPTWWDMIPPGWFGGWGLFFILAGI
jgi:hypothetical protein